jgi:hypothetical protein
MSQFAVRQVTRSAAGLVVPAFFFCLAFAQTSAAQPVLSHPDFAPTDKVGWTALTSEFIAPPGGPGPVMDDPAHPYVSNAIAARTGQVPTFPVGDISNPVLQPWAREAVRKHNELAIAGKAAYTPQARCWPMGVPAFLLYPVRPVYIVQTPKEVVMTWTGDHMSRHIYLDVPHSGTLKPSWFGESVGHYEGDTLVVDTTGLNDRTYVDNFRTPHTTQLHVVQRFQMIDGGKTLEVKVHVEDPGAFTTPWDAIQRYRRVEGAAMDEETCAEGARDYFNQEAEPIPQAEKADF